METKEYYDAHLGRFYSWMAGDFNTKQKEFYDFLVNNKLAPVAGGVAYDLGAGHGIQTVALAKAGYQVTAVDFSAQLLSELAVNAAGQHIKVVQGDIRTVHPGLSRRAEVVVCWGDTLTHLGSIREILDFIQDTVALLVPSGKLLLSFRDYSRVIEGPGRFIPVKSDDNRILTCVLEYEPQHVIVTDLLHERTSTGWEQRVMSYKKTRIDPDEIVTALEQRDLLIQHNHSERGMVTIIASRR
jgi:SAM-dependent methyltransferase